MARIALLYHPPGTRLFTVRDGKAVACEVKDVRVEREHLERREADYRRSRPGLTIAERADLDRRFNALSASIRVQKHDRQYRR